MRKGRVLGEVWVFVGHYTATASLGRLSEGVVALEKSRFL